MPEYSIFKETNCSFYENDKRIESSTSGKSSLHKN
jgi:hypothetical protein